MHMLFSRQQVVVVLMVLAAALTPTPSAAGVADPAPVTPEGVHAVAADQATDAQGDTAYAYVADSSFNLRIRRSGGALSPVLPLAPVEQPWSYFEVAVDRDGDGVAIWDQRIEEEARAWVMARRFTADGELGPVVMLTPDDHWVGDAEVALRPTGGVAVVTWERITGEGYDPYVRVLRGRTTLGPVQKVGRGPDADAPLIAMHRDGRATLVWTNAGLRARRLELDGSLSPSLLVRAPATADEDLLVTDLGIDRRGVVTAGCERYTRERTDGIPPVVLHHRACVLRISPRLAVLGRVRDLSPEQVVIDWVQVGVAPGGAAVVSWQKNYQAGVWAIAVRADGTLGERVRIANGAIGDISLTGDGDGVVTSQATTDAGAWRIRATVVRNGNLGSTRVVGRAVQATEYVRAALAPGGRFAVSWNDYVPTSRTWVATGRHPS